jgi:hypothetical protein
MSAPNVLALATLFLATTFAQAEWKEFTILFDRRRPGAPTPLHQISPWDAYNKPSTRW